MEWYLPIKETKNEKFSWWGMGWVGEKRIFFKVGKFWAHLNTDDEDRLVKLETQKWTEKTREKQTKRVELKGRTRPFNVQKAWI